MKLKLEKDIVFFDVETTGVDTTTARIVQIATIKYKTDGTVEEKCYLINPEIHIPQEASEIHGITDEMVADKPTFKQFSKNLRSYFEGCDLGGFNSNSYDINVLNEEFSRAGVGIIDWNPALVDVMLLYRQQYSGKLGEIYKRFFGEELDGAHDALQDCRATVKILDKLLKDSNISCTSEEFDVSLQGENERIDFSGKFYKKDGVVYWAFGKHKDKTIIETKWDKGYIEWFLNGSFPTDSKEILKQLLK